MEAARTSHLTGGGGIGMSLGYWQAIIEEKLFNRRTLVSYSSQAPSPIDGWISQLYSGHSDAS